jgi:hypothetical protein
MAATVLLDAIFDEPGWLRDRFVDGGPYWNQGRYLSAAGAASQMPTGATSTVGVPWYRQDWMLGGVPLVPGAESIAQHPRLARAAATVFAGDLDQGTIVRPHTVYANVQVPAPAIDKGHVDVPEFRGVTRDRFPVALLHLMNRSGLFAPWQLAICTAVTWLWEGPGGAFLLWEHGPDHPPAVFAAPLTNQAVVADNDRVFHGIGDFSTPDGPAPGELTPDSKVAAADGGWQLQRGGTAIGVWPWPTVRLSVSWKAYVFADAGAARTYDEHRDDLDEGRVVDTFLAALAERGTPFAGAPELGEELLFTLGKAWPKRLPVAARAA